MKTVVYGATRNLYKQMMACMNSLLTNGNINNVVLLIEDNHFPYPLPDNVRTINVEEQLWFMPENPNTRKRWTYMTMMRCTLTYLLPFYSKALWLDCDTIVEHDLSDLWDLDLDGYYYAAVKQPSDGRNGEFTNGDYFNTGVLMCNLEKLRDGKEAEIIKTLRTKEYDFPEQDAINELCAGRILQLPGRYNSCCFTEQDDRTYITHYAVEGLPLWEVYKWQATLKESVK